MTKRLFYEDDAFVITKPGVNSEISPELKEKESNHGNISYIQGMAVRSTPYLENYANQLRLWLHDKLSIYDAEWNTQKTAFSNEVSTIKNHINSTIADPVLPNLIYILTATLSGSILVSRRSLPLRFLSPVVFGTVATSYFAPNTFNNLVTKYENYEVNNFPEFNKEKHQFIQRNYETKSSINASLLTAKAELQNSIHDARLKVVDFFNKD